MAKHSKRDKCKITKRKLIQKIAEKCEYHLYEVEDMLYALYATLYDEIVQGNSIEFERLFVIEVRETKYTSMNQAGKIINFPTRKDVKLRLSETFREELKRIARAEAEQKKYTPQKYPIVTYPEPNPDDL